MIDYIDAAIRPATLNDLETVILFDATDDTPATSVEFSRKVIEGVIAAGGAYLAHKDGKAVGYCRIDHIWPERIPLLSWIYVEPAHRRTGLAEKLKARVYRDLREQGHEAILISVCTERPEMLEKMARQYPSAGHLTFLNGTVEYFFWHKLDFQGSQPARENRADYLCLKPANS